MPAIRIAVVAALALLFAPSAHAEIDGMLPAQLKSKYLKMDFLVDNNESVNFELPHLNYQNAGAAHHSMDSMKLKGKLLQLVNAELKKDKAGVEALIAPVKIKNNDPMFMYVFTGKGSPAQIEAVLKLAVRLKSKLGADWKDKGDLSASVKAFYLANIGLDCSGFVGNYSVAVGGKHGPNDRILSFAPEGKRVKKVADIKAGHAIVWKDNSHIAAIQGKRDDGKFDVVESNGDPWVKGLGTSVFEFKEGSGGGFKALCTHANGKKCGSWAEVYIAALK
jgi:hypothetical protein